MDAEVWAKLSEPFPADDIEWRIAERGKKASGEQWAKVLAYVTNRAIMQRLDDVLGPGNWQNHFQHISGAFLCGISVKTNGEWVTKWDGAQESQIEATKGGISGAMKRAAVQWGIGRYLYNLESGWADINPKGKNYAGKDQKKNLDPMKWDAPQLPAWALPGYATTTKAPEDNADHAGNAKLIKAEISAALYPKDVTGIMENRKAMITAMPKPWQDKLTAIADERRTFLSG